MNSQLKRGTLEMCVLVIVSRKDCYGYELINQISACMQITEGTIYPLLKRLKEQGSIDSYIVESQEGPPRKYYSITEEGERTKQVQLQEWQEFINGVKKIINGGGSDE
ncbi:MAG: PadR family transcriptional regulator [Oscillospiraceae bacterium]|nr:PadR family transcriptional regulator [Oscillospiraceae bacterium]